MILAFVNTGLAGMGFFGLTLAKSKSRVQALAARNRATK